MNEKIEQQLNDKVLSIMIKEFLSIRPIFGGMPGSVEYFRTKKVYDKLCTKVLSKTDLSAEISKFNRELYTLKKTLSNIS